MAIEEAIITSLPEVSPEHAAPIEPQPDASLPDFMTSPDATLGDKEAVWRYGKPPDYSRTREEWAQSEQPCSPVQDDSTDPLQQS